MTFERTVVIVAGLALLGIIVLMLITQYSANTGSAWPPYEPQCPDYWKRYSDNTCGIPSYNQNEVNSPTPFDGSLNINTSMDYVFSFSITNTIDITSTTSISSVTSVTIPSGTAYNANTWNNLLFNSFDKANLYYINSYTGEKNYYVYVDQAFPSYADGKYSATMTLKFIPVPKNNSSDLLLEYYKGLNFQLPSTWANPTFYTNSNGYQYIRATITPDPASSTSSITYPSAAVKSSPSTDSTSTITKQGTSATAIIGLHIPDSTHDKPYINFSTYTMCQKKKMANLYNVAWNGVSYGNDLICEN
jgi:hypothetical protein